MRLTLRYVLALSLIAIAVTGGYGVLHVVVERSSNAVLINIAGRQRMLSQRIAYLTHTLVHEHAADIRGRNAARLSAAVELMAASHDAMIKGSESMGVPALEISEAKRQYFDPPSRTDAMVRDFVAAGRNVVKGSAAGDRLDSDRADVRFILTHAPKDLLDRLDALVLIYQQADDGAFERVLTGVLIWVGMLLLLLVFLGVAVFRPMVHWIDRRIGSLVTEFERLKGELETLSRKDRLLLAVQKRDDAIASSIPGVIFRAIIRPDDDGKILYLSGSVEDFFGLSREAGIANATTLNERIHEDDRDTYLATLRAAARDQVDWHHEFRLVPRAGEERLMRGYATLYRDDNGEAIADGIILDISEIARAKAEVENSEETLNRYISDLEMSQGALENQTSDMAALAERYNEERMRAEASDRSKSEFLASMSHEIRTPMTGVMGLADILLDSNVADEHKDHIRKIKGATKGLLTIINDILDLSKLDAGKLEIERIDFALLDLIDDVANLLRRNAERKGLALNIDIDADVPNGINADPTRIRQILLNLIGNAVKFTQNGSVTLRVLLASGNEDAGTLCIEIIDTGVGIPESSQNKLFSDFTQADASISREFEGTGLGLAICKRLVGLMDGEIRLTSVAGSGSTFWFTVPFAAATTPVTEKSGAGSVEVFRAVRPLRILVAEDNRLNQMIITTLLGRYGHVLNVVDDGAQAVEAMRAVDRGGDERYDMILCDIRMPEMSGPDVTRAIRADGHTLPIVALTADAVAEHVRGYLAVGMDACVTKPIDMKELLTTINRVLDEEVHVPDENPPKHAFPMANPCAAIARAIAEDVDDVHDNDNDGVTDFLNQLGRIADNADNQLKEADDLYAYRSRRHQGANLVHIAT